jgi:hydroxymethylpyrimidine pyrophosphatase-like HAD family hydrolase
MNTDPQSGSAEKIFDSDCLGYMEQYAFSFEIIRKIPYLQEKIDKIVSPYRQHISPARLRVQENSVFIEPVELHSSKGLEHAQNFCDRLAKEALNSGTSITTHLNSWGGRIEVNGFFDLEKIQAIQKDFFLSCPRVGVRYLSNIPTQLLIKPVPHCSEKSLRDEILQSLPFILKDAGLEDLHFFPAGRTAIDILRNQCSKKTALEHFSSKLRGNILYFGDEFENGNDESALQVENLFACSVGAKNVTMPEKLVWMGGKERGVYAVLRKILEEM